MAREAPYLEVAEALRTRVRGGEWATGERLPSRARLAEEYGVGRNVTQRAVDLLIVEGLLEGRAGSGTYVREPRERHRMVRTRGEGGPGPGAAWEVHSDARVPAPADIARRLKVAEGDPCVRTRYEFVADHQPVHLSVSWEPMGLTGATPIVLPELGPMKGKGVVARMRSIGVEIARAVEIPRPARATATEAALLGITPGDLLLHIERTYYATDGRPVETADITVPDLRLEIAYEIGLGHG
ncbi:GntR family transcriptional regulator [Streptantibioticus parmotrematis]|uniref:GntR family transcriptional regulator n=1 Tax=Streptantibioticus parmotrematis TaxID=2873249 RepID=UPI0033F8BE23